eukprot:4969375-Heterocapsa_arctica.AAC.1
MDGARAATRWLRVHPSASSSKRITFLAAFMPVSAQCGGWLVAALMTQAAAHFLHLIQSAGMS